jgi:hypothetical protein
MKLNKLAKYLILSILLVNALAISEKDKSKQIFPNDLHVHHLEVSSPVGVTLF